MEAGAGEGRVPLARPTLGSREEELVLEVLRSGRLSLGPMLERFEDDFAAWLEVPDAVAVSSGTTALHLGVRALGWGGGDEVVSTPLSFIASSNCLLYEGAEPVFADVDPVTLTLDPAAAEAAIGPRTAGLLPVHIFGYPAAIETLEGLAAERGLAVLEDCAQALGARDHEGRAIGARGNPSAFAFYANKQITTGEGGVLVPGGVPGAGERARSERNQGRGGAWERMDHVEVGFNYRLSDVAAALGVAQLERLEALVEARRTVADRYGDLLSEIGAAEPGAGDPDDLVLPVGDRGEVRRSPFVYVIRMPVAADRDAAIEELGRRGIDSRPYLPCIHTTSAYRERFGERAGQFPVAEEFSRRALALPFFPGLEEEQMERVVGALADILGRRR